MGPPAPGESERDIRQTRRASLKRRNAEPQPQGVSKTLDSSMKRHTALIKRMRQSLGADNHDQIIKDIDSLSLEKYIDEISGAALEGIGKCKTERDIWSAVEVISALHRRFLNTFTPSLISNLSTSLAPPSRAAVASLPPEQREKEDSVRVSRQRPVLRVCAELALVGIIKDGEGRSGGEWLMKTLRDLLSNDPTLSSLPLLTTFLKSYARTFLGISPPPTKQQIPESAEPGDLAPATAEQSTQEGRITADEVNEDDFLVEKEIKDRLKRMCEGYFESVSKKLVIEHKRLQEQDRKNHEAYIRSGEIFEDRQQAYEKMAKGYEKLLLSCQTLSEMLYLPMPTLPKDVAKPDSIILSTSGQATSDELYNTGGKWDDEEERRFFEDIQDLKDFVPKSVLGIEEKAGVEETAESIQEKQIQQREEEQEQARQLEEELKQLDSADLDKTQNGLVPVEVKSEDEDDNDDDVPTPIPTPPRTPTPPTTPTLAPQGPSQLLTVLLARLPDATNRSAIDKIAVEFAFLNSKAARKRLTKFLTQVPKTRTDLLPHYSRLVATLNKYMPDIGADLVAFLEEEFRYLQRKKNVVRELFDTRQRNAAYFSNLTKFKVVPTHVILHIFKECLDHFYGVNIENVAMLLEGCGRFLLRSDETRARFTTMIELMRRKQSIMHLDQRQVMLLESAYYQCNPPERTPREEKIRTPMESYIRHLLFNVLSKSTIDKVLKSIRKLDWDNAQVVRWLFKGFTKPWKIKYSNIPLLSMLVYDLRRYHPNFAISVVDQVLEDIRRGMEINIYEANQQRMSTIKYLGELYINRMVGSGVICDTLWSLVTFGHADGRPLPHHHCRIDMPDDFFRIRLVCVLLDTCGMCFDKGSQKQKLDNFLIFFQFYVFTKISLPMDVDFMLSDTLDALRPKQTMFKTVEEAAAAVDEMFNVKVQVSDADADDSGDDSGDEGDEEGGRRGNDEDEEENAQHSPSGERAPSPDTLVLLSTNKSENFGPTEEDEAEFNKELAKMVVESVSEPRKVDKRGALWDANVLPVGLRKKKADSDDEEQSDDSEIMKFTVLSKKGNKQQAKVLAIPAASAIAVHTKSAQLQDREEHQQVKRIVLDYNQREETEELRALENRNRNGAIKVRFLG